MLAFEHLNLRRNPFGEPPAKAWSRLAVADIDGFEKQLRNPGFAVQFIGEQGRGKSTHLRLLQTRFPAAPFVYFGPGERPSIPRGEVLFLDETQRMSWCRRELVFRRRVARERVSLAIGTHQDHAKQLERIGFEVVTVEVRGLTPEKLKTIVERRIEWARRGAGPVPMLTSNALEELIHHFGDDLRAIGDYLYDIFQNLESTENVELEM